MLMVGVCQRVERTPLRVQEGPWGTLFARRAPFSILPSQRGPDSRSLA